jgi:putative transposase
MWTDVIPTKTFMSSKDLEGKVFKNSQWISKTYWNASKIVRSCLAESSEGYNYPKIKNVSIELCSIDFQKIESKDFDGFFRVYLPYGRKEKVKTFLPVKFHKHSRKYSENGWILKKTFILKKIKETYYVDLIWEKPEEAKREEGPSIGIDIGYKKLISDSEGNLHGKNLEDFYLRLSKKKRGSKNFKQLNIHKKNEINRVCNEFQKQTQPKELFVEDLKNVKHKSKLSSAFLNKLQYWSYRQVLGKLERLSEEKGFLFQKVSPAYSSQTCSNCGVVEKENRKGEHYLCTCGLSMDADHNAAINILHRGTFRSSAEGRISI